MRWSYQVLLVDALLGIFVSLCTSCGGSDSETGNPGESVVEEDAPNGNEQLVVAVEKEFKGTFPPSGNWENYELEEILGKDIAYRRPWLFRGVGGIPMRFAFCRDGTVGYIMRPKRFKDDAPERKDPRFLEKMRGSISTFVVDGVHGPSYRWIYDPALMPHGTALGYKVNAYRLSAQCLVRKPFHVFYPGSRGVYISPDGKRIAYIVNPEDPPSALAPAAYKGFVQIGDERGESFDQVRGVSFSPDGRRYAYFAQSGKRWFIVVDGTKVELPFTPHGFPVFSPDGRDIAYGAMGPALASSDYNYSICFVVLNHKRLDTYSFRYDENLALIGMDGSESINPCVPYFSPDGRNIVYAARDGEHDNDWVIVSKGVKTLVPKQARRCDPGIEVLGVAPDGSAVYQGHVIAPPFLFVGDNERNQIVVDGMPIELKQTYAYVSFSRDGRRMAYAAEDKQGGVFVVFEDLSGTRKGKTFSWVSYYNIVISPDGQYIAYSAKEKDSYLIVLNDVELEARSVDPIDCIYFSDDSAKLFFGTFDGHDLWWHTATLKE